MLEFIVLAAVVVGLLWAGARLFLIAPDHSKYERPIPDSAAGRTAASPENEEVLRRFEALMPDIRGKRFFDRLDALRTALDNGIIGAPISPEALGVTKRALMAGDVPAEWILAPDSDPDRRLLYIHGGGFIAGSPSSARMVAASLAKKLGTVVLSIDYRLAPGNRRIRGIEDVQSGYRWMLANGPDGAAEARDVYVAGDSAGGNLALMLSAWTRDQGVRAMDAVIAFAPSTDALMTGSSFRSNIETDPLLGPPLAPLIKLPISARAWLVLAISQMNPRNPLASPLFGELHELPPTLIQSSDCECLSDDARRYVNKATEAGGRAELQVWPGMFHVFQMYGHILPETAEAFDSVAAFINESADRRSQAGSAGADELQAG